MDPVKIAFRCDAKLGVMGRGQPTPDDPDPAAIESHKIDLTAHPRDDGNVELWGGKPDAHLALGNVPPALAGLFTLGKSYEVTVKEID